MVSMHYIAERERREKIIATIGEGVEVAAFIVDRGHKNGAERHVLTTTGIIVIYNARSGRLITKLIARPGQIRRYYPDGNAPAKLLEIAYIHYKQNLNRIA